MRIKRMICILTALALAFALLVSPVFAESVVNSPLTLSFTKEGEAFAVSVRGLNGQLNIYAVQLDLILNGEYAGAKLTPADSYVESPDKAAVVANGKTYLTSYLNSQAPMNDGKNLLLGYLNIRDKSSIPATAEIILLDSELRPVSFKNSPVVSAEGGNSGSSGGSSGGSGGGSSPSAPELKDTTVSAGIGGQAVLTQKELEKAQSLAIENKNVNLYLSEAAVKKLRAAGTDITINLKEMMENSQDKGLLAQTGGSTLYSVSICAAEKNLSVGETALTIPFDGKGAPVAYIVSSTGALTKLGALSAADGKVTLKLQDEGTVAVLDVLHNFKDVDGWYDGYVNTLAGKGIMSGLDQNTFAPQKVMTRAELVTMLFRISGGQLNPAEGAVFSDVPADAWFAPYVEWAIQNGVANGVSETAFDPQGPVTREQLAVILARFMDMQGIVLSQETAAAEFTDIGEVSDYAVEAVRKMQRSGVISGKGDGRFEPKSTATRAECAKMIAILLEKIK